MRIFRIEYEDKDFNEWKEYLIKEGYIDSTTSDTKIISMALGVAENGEPNSVTEIDLD